MNKKTKRVPKKSNVCLDQWCRGYIKIKTKRGLPPMLCLTKVIASQFKHDDSMEELAKTFNCSLSLIEDAIRFELKNTGGYK